MTKEDIKKGIVVYYARILRQVGTYEIIELLIRTVEDDSLLELISVINMYIYFHTIILIS